MSSATAPILAHFKQYIRVNEALQDALTERVQAKVYKKGELIHHADTVCTRSHFILKGMMRLYFLKDGKEVSEYFCAEGEWVNSPRSMMQRKLDIYFIDTIEVTETFSIEVRDLVYLFDHFPEMERYARLSMGSLFGHFMERITSMRFTTAKEKYQHFCETYHDIYHRIPLGMVASYLGITQETLSRIRSKV